MTKRASRMFASLSYGGRGKSLTVPRGNYYGIDTNRIADMISEIINTDKVDRFTI